MKNIIKLAIISASFAVTHLAFADIAVIVHPSNEATISESDVVKLFLGKAKRYNSGSTANPIAQSGVANEEFNEKVLNKSASQVKAYWSKLVFTGRGTMPKKMDNDAGVKKQVADNPEAIGYIDAGQVDASVKVVLTL